MKLFSLLLLSYLVGCLPLFSQSPPSDTLTDRVWKQTVLFPQEKLYLHLDKPTYVVGEKVWLRAYVVNASSNLPETASRYVYTELINPFNQVVERVCFRQDEQGYIYGHIALSDTLPSGEYSIRGYTRYMENLGSDYLFTKNIQIISPLSKSIQVTPVWKTDKKVEFCFTKPSTGDAVEIFTSSVYTEAEKSVHQQGFGKITTTINRNKLKNKALLVEGGNYKQFFLLPPSGNDYEVSFMPEGGYLLEGVLCKVAFKAINSNGREEAVTGQLVDGSGQVVATFQSTHAGMGIVSFVPSPGQTYKAVCRNSSGVEKEFLLPASRQQGYALKIDRHKGRIFLHIQGASGTHPEDSLWVLVHQRGLPQYTGLCTKGNRCLTFDSSTFSSGILHFLLLDTRFNILSERLFFINNLDKELGRCLLSGDKPVCQSREKVVLNLDFTGKNASPLSGSCSLSVTDNRDVLPDSLVNIFTTLLLSSDLKGHITNPAWYFAPDENGRRAGALDLLMLTQGWRRYNYPEVVLGRYQMPSIFPEESMELSGRVITRLLSRPVKGTKVGISAPAMRMIEQVETDDFGRFSLKGFEFPDTTKYLINAFSKKGGDKVVLAMDTKINPVVVDPFIPSFGGDFSAVNSVNMDYLSKVDTKLLYEQGIRHLFLGEVVVTASKVPRYKTRTEITATHVFREETFKKKGSQSMGSALAQIVPNIWFKGDHFTYRGRAMSLYVDDVYIDRIFASFLLNNLPASDIAQVDVVKVDTNFDGGVYGTLYVTLKTGEGSGADYSPTNVSLTRLLGYQPPVEFYSPKYDTPKQEENSVPDLRTTLYWKPDVTIREGKAKVEFYTADGAVDYTIVVEGVANDGTILYLKQLLQR